MGKSVMEGFIAIQPKKVIINIGSSVGKKVIG